MHISRQCTSISEFPSCRMGAQTSVKAWICLLCVIFIYKCITHVDKFFSCTFPAGEKGRHWHGAAHDWWQSFCSLCGHTPGWHGIWLKQGQRREVFLWVGQRLVQCRDVWRFTCYSCNVSVCDYSFFFNPGQVIKAWDIGVATMKVGELCQFICKPEYAYGTAGSPPKIPPNATLIFEVRFCDIFALRLNYIISWCFYGCKICTLYCSLSCSNSGFPLCGINKVWSLNAHL